MSTYIEKLRNPKWQKKRLEILKRDSFNCTVCGDDKKTLHVHHRAYFPNTEPWDIKNELLVTLCKDCHANETDSIKEASKALIQNLKTSGFSSTTMFSLATVFRDTDRNWGEDESAFSVIKFLIDNQNIWDDIKELCFKKKAE